MKTITTPVTFHLNPESNQRLAGLCGEYNFNLKQVEERLGVKISNRGHLFCIDGRSDAVKQAGTVLQALYRDTETDPALTAEKVHLAISQIPYDEETGDPETQDVVIRFRKTIIQGRNPNQRSYLRNIMAHDLTFGIGPAGTGKTYLAVACAVQALADNEIDRIVLVRPAIEAGERLGFLPGDIGQKVDPYLRPLYDALYEMLGFERVGKLMVRGIIELAPLAYMRGRTLNESFIILDEAQNTTSDQMKMFLTRIGFGSKSVITGDVTQVDLPKGSRSGLRHASGVLAHVEGMAVSQFTSRDVVRHPLVQKIVEAYEVDEGERPK